MCYKKLCKWQQVAQDATTALSHNRDLMKAHYLLGVARRELRDVQQAITHLSKALEAAREQGDSIKDEIWRELAKAKYAAWQQDSKQRSAQAEAVKQQLDSLLRSQWLQGCVANATGNTAGMNGSKDGLEQEQQDLQEQLQAVLQVRVLAALPAWRNQPAATAGVELASCSACVHARPQIAHPVRSFVTV
eukprot:GHUV01040426.1.p1 GENE.GHUV01040426.1~~GHUV01040426.1.p1  ORF type:complete len:190 (+),score=65.20 GHUV01040426.1:715-1284(+)